jgi:hypothetical protein
MAEYEDDDPTREEGPVIVKRAVHDAARKFEKTVKPEDGAPFEAARQKSMAYKKAGKDAAAARWHDIYNFLMSREGVSASTATVILKPGETWDAEEEKVIKPPARRPRSGKASR